MKTFLKIALIAFGVLVLIKLLPFTLIAGCVIGAVAAAALVVGVSSAAVILCVAALLLAVFSPIWLPVAAVIGIVSLFRRNKRASA